MLSVVRKDKPLNMSHTEQPISSAGGFGKMLNSLQGLQQRLEYFSIADIANAEANAQTLILRLKQVQDNVAALAKVKTAAVTISQYLTETPEFDTDVVAFDSLENHPQLHAIIKASKLIKLHRLLTALKAGAE